MRRRKVYVKNCNTLWYGVDEYGTLVTKKHSSEKDVMDELGTFPQELNIVSHYKEKS